MPLMRTSETPLNAFLWRADDGPTLNAGFAALWFFRGSRLVLLRNPFCDFSAGLDPCPLSVSAHVCRLRSTKQACTKLAI